LLLPELWSTGYDLAHAAQHATPIDQGLFVAMGDLARQHRLTIAGSLLEMHGGRFCNTATLFLPDGRLAAMYRKVHRFRLMDEDRYLAAGDAAPTFDLPWGKTALAICYDLRFPELFRRYALEGARLVLVPAEWPSARIEHWCILVWARAIENQCFVAACNRVGESKGERFSGYSLAINPWGEVLVEGGEAEALLVAQIDLNLVDEVRRCILVFADRRPDVYGFGA
jgi:predicted amidohydrolase